MQRPSDTSPGAHERYLRALAAMRPEERLAIAANLSDEVRSLAEAGIRSRHPEFGPEEIDGAVADLLLGRQLAEKRASRATTTDEMTLPVSWPTRSVCSTGSESRTWSPDPSPAAITANRARRSTSTS